MNRFRQEPDARLRKKLGVTSIAEIYFDGLCEPKNPGGIPVYSFAISVSERGQFLAQQAGLAGEPWTENATHNLAEYMGAIKAVEWLQEHSPVMKMTIFGDSQLVIRQLNKEYQVRSLKILPLHKRLTGLLEGLEWKAVWIPRDKNALADKLGSDFYKDYCIRHHGKVLPTMRETGAIA